MPLRALVALWNKGNSVLKGISSISYPEQHPFKIPQLPALRTVVNEPAQQKHRFVLLLYSQSIGSPSILGENVFQQPPMTCVTRCRQGLQACFGGNGYHLSPIHPAQRPAWPNRGVLSSFCSSAPPAAQSGSGLPHGTAPGYSRGRCFPCRKVGGFWDRPPQIL